MIEKIKSHWYYVFWGVCTASFFTGQLLVAFSYREMAEATKSSHTRITCETPYQINVIPHNREFE